MNTMDEALALLSGMCAEQGQKHARSAMSLHAFFVARLPLVQAWRRGKQRGRPLWDEKCSPSCHILFDKDSFKTDKMNGVI
ncbi:hypothetical protein C1X05_02430 [Laceyella sacchari]|nr:hypothetical protein C1X05_02430 [Laceyella sacchari]